MSEISASQPPALPEGAPPGAALRLGVYARYGKLGLNLLVVGTTVTGYLLASDARVDWLRLAWTILGTLLAAAGASMLNQWVERRRDALMQRTRRRPLPQGELTPGPALIVALAVAGGGVGLLWLLINPLTALLALSVQVVYILAYTPLKTITPLATVVGAYCGAVPPLMGFSAATGRLEAGAWGLAALLFIWQVPHFLALAMLYRDDYARGGFRVLPVVDPGGTLTARLLVLYSLALVPVSLWLVICRTAGLWYALGAILLGVGLVGLGLALKRDGTRLAARRMFLASVIYLPLIMGLLLANRTPPTAADSTVSLPQVVAPATDAAMPGLNATDSKRATHAGAG